MPPTSRSGIRWMSWSHPRGDQIEAMSRGGRVNVRFRKRSAVVALVTALVGALPIATPAAAFA